MTSFRIFTTFVIHNKYIEIQCVKAFIQNRNHLRKTPNINVITDN